MTIYVLFSQPIDDYCAVSSLQFGMDVERIAGGGEHRAQASSIAFTKKKDDLTHDLFVAVASGKPFANVDIEYWQDHVCTFVYHLANVRVVKAYTRLGQEDYTLDFEKIWTER